MELAELVDGDLYNGRIVRVSNNFVFKEPVFNYSADFPFLWDEIKIPVKFGRDYGLARDILEKSAVETVHDYADETEIYWNIENESKRAMISMLLTNNWAEVALHSNPNKWCRTDYSEDFCYLKIKYNNKRSP